MSDYDPLSFAVAVVFDTVTQEFACRMECTACDTHEPEAVATWTTDRALGTLNDKAREHWAKWHATHRGPYIGECPDCDGRG